MISLQSIPGVRVQGIFFLIMLILSGCSKKSEVNPRMLRDRIYGMLMGSAVADAMAGPHEGRNTEESQQFLDEDGWIDSFDSPYNHWYQSHWNVFQSSAPPGTYTDDSRLRLFVAECMVEAGESNFIDRGFLAHRIFGHYRAARTQYLVSEDQEKKAAFLKMWFWWELTKLATSERIPEADLLSPPAVREELLDEKGERTGHWKLVDVEVYKVSSNLKQEWHDGSYKDGKEWPMGMITLLPLAIYFPGEPEAAFAYGIEMDFLDIGNAPLYPAFFMALVADGLGGRDWSDVRSRLVKEGVTSYTGYAGSLDIHILEPQVKQALQLSEQFRLQDNYPSKENYISFVKALHKTFAIGTDYDMCTCEEMLTVPLALTDYSMELGLNTAIEYGVNYGRDNDTVASFVATLVGVCLGKSNLRTEWITSVQSANDGVNIEELSQKLSLPDRGRP